MRPFAFIRSRTRRALLAALAAAVCQTSQAAAPVSVDPVPTLGDYHHTRWSADEGAPPAILSMAQTRDGWLWLGTLDGLFRFDGVRFTRYPLPPGLGLNRNLIRYLHAGPRGELYIVRAAEGITVLEADGRLRDLAVGPAGGRGIETLAVDADGAVWIVAEGLHRLEGNAWRTVEDGPEWRKRDTRNFLLDAAGRLWISRFGSTWRLERHGKRFEKVLDHGGDLLAAPDGRLWLLSDDRALRLLADDGTPAPVRAPEALSSGGFAQDGALWMPGCPDRPCVLPAAALGAGARPGEVFQVRPQAVLGADTPAPLSGRTPGVLLVDREGSTWISTEGGIDRFRRKRVLPSGLPGDGAGYSLASDADGQVWAAHAPTGKLWRLLPQGAAPVTPRHPVSVLARDPAGALLLGGRRSIWRNGPDALEVPLPPGPGGKPADMRMIGILDDGKLLWTATFETGLIAWRDGRWHPHTDFRLPARIYQSALAGPGQLWLATGDGELFHYDAAPNASPAPVDIRALGMTAAIFPGPELLLSGDNGAGVVRGGRLRMLRAAEPNALRNVSGMVTTNDGDRWLNGAAGLVHVSAADWQRSMVDPDVPLRFEIFDRLDGYPGRAVVESRWRSAWSGDGRTLWLVATGGVVRVDTANLARNRVAPTPVILALATERETIPVGGPAQAAVTLAPGTERVRIDFTAPSLRMPERVRFEYMLEGVDAAWQDAGARRSTSYTGIAPGAYVFHLRAVNEDGVRSAAQASLPFRLAPTLWQTTPFKLLAAGAIALLLALAYRYRVRQLTRRAAERVHVRMAERERIARTLHDTFLQTVHSLVLRVDAIAARLPPGERARRELEEVLRDAGGALGEGREQLQELRSPGDTELERQLNEAIGRLHATHPEIAIGLRVEGRRRPVAVDAAAEIVAIAREALHNACVHAGAGQVRADLDYGADGLFLRVADDGRGIDPALLKAGVAGHWGLVGMRERAARIKARLDIAPGSEGGTTVILAVLAARAYTA